MNKSIHKRFWEKVKIGLPDDCWEFTGGLNKGYGVFSIESRAIIAHRVSWMMLRGPIPKGKLVLHKCDNRKCVNPNHLYIGTYSDNNYDRSMRYIGRIGKVSRFHEGEIWLMRRLFRAGINRYTIMKMFKISRRYLYNLMNGECGINLNV